MNPTERDETTDDSNQIPIEKSAERASKVDKRIIPHDDSNNRDPNINPFPKARKEI